MAMNDLLSDMIARIKNGQNARLSHIMAPYSKLLVSVLEVLQREGYIMGHEVQEENNKKSIEIQLKYFEGDPVIRRIKRVSKPGRRTYAPIKKLEPIHNGLGISILSTSSGVMSDYEARMKNIGGEVLCSVF